ncbi:signal peptidase complex subunit 1-like isoform X1 [Tripterygium wilfordii]|uniref:Signal peptidase complex subunit 1-like isoform X1 n=1 Tax=Tripterygium wilfordii TaxID=458696 RepID=A0A7J7D0Z3_TRIWF|nr:signal peptidase complex-like protein DTM1 [Tripterygium wilfordii]KAF5739736.1 signal peptidase complex subunit 1-like isoform X1 [Tripterygium wilfordii]
MANDAALRSCLVWLAVIMVVVGLCTHSFKKIMVTYVVGILLIAGVLLPDWDFFSRDFSRWGSPITFQEKAAAEAQRSGPLRYRIYPIRLVAYTTIYSFALYKWWWFISS